MYLAYVSRILIFPKSCNAYIDSGPSWYTATSAVKENGSPALTVMVSVVELPVKPPTLHLRRKLVELRYLVLEDDRPQICGSQIRHR